MKWSDELLAKLLVRRFVSIADVELKSFSVKENENALRFWTAFIREDCEVLARDFLARIVLKILSDSP